MVNTAVQPKGFSLIELMTVIAIIGILAAFAVPQYAQYTKKAKFSELIQVTAEFKSAVQLCAQDRNELKDCSGGQHLIPNNITIPEGYVQSLTVLAGKITATATNELDSTQYILESVYTPTSNTLRWTSSGSCQASGLC